MRFRLPLISAAVIGLFALAACEVIEQASAETELDVRPEFTAEGELVLPEGYHEWVYLGSPLTPNGLNNGEAGFPEFHNVYIQPGAYKAYKNTGRFPEGTILFKELQLVKDSTHPDGSSDQASGRGYFPGAFNGADVAVKDTARFPDTNGWGYFNFGHHAPPYAETAQALPADACASCHTANAEKDMVFTQFYTLLQ